MQLAIRESFNVTDESFKDFSRDSEVSYSAISESCGFTDDEISTAVE